jgi:FkbM family methyltransferase
MFWSGGLARFEPRTVRALRAAIEPGDVVFDVGANIGFFATLISRLVGPSGRVVAIEPEPENLGLLRANLDANGCGNVVVVPVAVGERPGSAVFSLDEATGSTGHLGGAPTAGEMAVGTGRVRLIETPVETIDRVAAGEGAVPDVIKMDIEGGELHALLGAAETLRQHRPILLSEVTGDSAGEVIRLIEAHRYAIWDLESGRAVRGDDRPFMVAAIPIERLESPRGLRVRAAVTDGRREANR